MFLNATLQTEIVGKEKVREEKETVRRQMSLVIVHIARYYCS
jgi:hypothetical protein